MEAGILQSYGLGVFLAISILGIAWYLLKKTFENHGKERDIWLKLTDTHFEQLHKADEFQREEHKEILEGLRKLNGK